MAKINNRAAVIASCWFAVAIIASVYIWVALGGGYLGDILFGLFVPVGLLVAVAFIVTFGLSMTETQPEKETKLQTTTLQEINAKIDALTKEVETIKKEIEA